jgi:hypothetical protein
MESSSNDIETFWDACLYPLTEYACRQGIRCIEEDTIDGSMATTSMKDSAQHYCLCHVPHFIITGY